MPSPFHSRPHPWRHIGFVDNPWPLRSCTGQAVNHDRRHDSRRYALAPTSLSHYAIQYRLIAGVRCIAVEDQHDRTTLGDTERAGPRKFER